MSTSKLMIVLMLVSTAACGREPGSYAGFEGHVSAFVAEGKARGITVDTYGLDIKLVDAFDDPSSLAQGTIGLCYWSTGRVQILRSEWNNNLLDREELIFHEMGHCLLGRGHSTCPDIMCPNVIGYAEYSAHRSHYLDLLFKP